MAADGHLVALPDELRTLIYFSHPMAVFGRKQLSANVCFWPHAVAPGVEDGCRDSRGQGDGKPTPSVVIAKRARKGPHTGPGVGAI